MYGYIKTLTSAVLLVGISGCAYFSQDQGAPVVDIQPNESLPLSGIHIIMQGETLYEIAWRYGKDYRDLAKMNQIRAPYIIYPGQKLNLRAPKLVVSADKSPSKKSVSQQVVVKKPVLHTISQQKAAKPNIHQGWGWPVKGKVIKSFSLKGAQPHKGIDIAGTLGTPIRAASGGIVVYSGMALRGYGQLIIIKHNDAYLSAYAHNNRLLVKEGTTVNKGQVIAEMGQSETDRVKLHFEIRENGKPINPITVLGT